MSITEISDLHYLGRICLRSHDYNQTGKSLRLKSTRACLGCNKEKAFENYQLIHKPARQAARKNKKSSKQEKLLSDSAKYEFDPSLYYLSNICIHGHNWHNTGQSLRRINDYSCEMCRQEVARKKNAKATSSVIQRSLSIATNRAVEPHLYGFNSDLFYLGRLCKENHNWRESNKSLRRTSSRSCIECEKIRRKIYQASMPEDVKQKRREHSKQYYSSNKNYFDEKSREYRVTPNGKRIAREANRRYRARLKNVFHIPYTDREIDIRIDLFNNCCAYCGNELHLVHLDHFLPIAKNGPDIIGNLVPACPSCNCSKKKSDPEKWYRSRRFFSEERWVKLLTSIDQDWLIKWQLRVL